MRRFISILVLVMLLCGGIATAQDREYVPMLVEGQKWVYELEYLINTDLGAYVIEVKGDTIVEGRTYKKVYRYHPELPQQLPPYFTPYISKYHPAACLREEAGVVYRLCDKIKYEADEWCGDYDYYFDYDKFIGWGFHSPSYFYLKVANSTDEHYEVVLYDFNNVDSTYFKHPHLNISDDIIVDGTARRTQSFYNDSFINEDGLIIEGLGSVTVTNGDLITPIDTNNARGAGGGWLSTLLFVTAPDGRMIFNHKNAWYAPNYVDDYPDFYSEYCAHNNLNRFDFNGDGITDVDEVNVAVNSILNDKAPEMRADMNVDHVVDIDDVNALINYILSK